MKRGLRNAIGAPLRAVLKWLGASSFDQQFVTWLRANTQSGDVARPMEQITAVYSGVRAIAQTIGGFTPVLYRGSPANAEGRDNIVTRGPAFDLVSQPLPGVTAAAWQEQWAGHLVESGEAHVLLERGQVSGKPRRMNVVGGRQMNPERDPADGELRWWWYTPQGGSGRVRVMPEEDRYTRLANPYDKIRGLSPLAAAALGMKQDYLASTYNVAALGNGGAPGGLYVHPGTPGEDERKEMRESIRERHSGVENANRPGFLWGGMDYKQTAWKNTDLELLQGRKFNREEIFNALGVPSVIVAIYEAAHYDVADKSIEIFLLFTVLPLVRAYEAAMNLSVLPAIEPGVALYLDMQQHPVLQRVQWAKIDALTKAIQTGIPYNEAIKLVGLMLKQQAWGDTSLLPATLASAAEVAAGLAAPGELDGSDEATERPAAAGDEGDEEKTGTEGPRDQGTEDGDDDAEQSSTLLREAAASGRREAREVEWQTRKATPAIARRYRAHFVRQEREIAKRIKRVLGSQGAGNATATHRLETGATVHGLQTGATAGDRLIAGPTEDEAEALARKILLRVTSEEAALRDIVSRTFPDAAKQALREALAGLDLSQEELEKLVAKFTKSRLFAQVLRAKKNQVSGIERTTRRRVQAALIEGIKQGEDVQQLTQRLHEVMAGEQRFRALRIARTEAGQAVSTARFAAAAAAGAKFKVWLTGSNPRQTHVAAGRQYDQAGAIPMGEAFRVGREALMYPRDPRGSAAEIVNCNCVMVTVRGPSTPDEGRSTHGPAQQDEGAAA